MLAASLYGMGFDRAKELTPRVEPFFPLFAAAMNLVLIADDAYAFLFSWELMSLASWALVVARHTDPESRRAAHLYLVMAAIGTVALLFAFGGLAGPAGGYAFDTIRAHRAQADGRGPGAGGRAGRLRLEGRARFRCTPGCRSPIRRRRATSRR